MNNTRNLIPSPFSTDMQDDWNDFAQSESDEPKLVTKDLADIYRLYNGDGIFGDVNPSRLQCCNSDFK